MGIQPRSPRSILVPFGIALVAIGLALWLSHHGHGGGGIGSRVGAAAMLGAATVGTALLVKGPVFSRPIMVTSAAIMSAAACVAAGLSKGGGDVITSGLSAWAFVWMLAVSPAMGKPWCRSGRAALAGACLLGLAFVAAEVIQISG